MQLVTEEKQALDEDLPLAILAREKEKIWVISLIH